MVDYKELIAALIAEATKTVSKEEILDFIEIPGDEKWEIMRFPASGWPKR